MKCRRVMAWIVLAELLMSSPSFADTVTLKNGRKLEGIVTSQDNEADVVLEVGSGQLILTREEVLLVTRADDEKKQALRADWLKKRLDAEAAFQLGLTQERLLSSERSRLEALTPKQTTLIVKGSHLYVEASINDGPKEQLLLDTGAPYICLSRKMGEVLGLLDEKKWRSGKTEIAGQTIPCLFVKLDKVEVQGFWARDVDAIVFMEDGEDWVYKQNILGLSYLDRFHFQVNIKKRELTLSWEEL